MYLKILETCSKFTVVNNPFTDFCLYSNLKLTVFFFFLDDVFRDLFQGLIFSVNLEIETLLLLPLK